MTVHDLPLFDSQCP